MKTRPRFLLLWTKVTRSPPLGHPGLHNFLFVRQRDSHLFKGYPIQRAGRFKALRSLILLQTPSRVWIQFSCLLTNIEAMVAKNLLSLLNLILVGSKDGTAFLRRLGGSA